MAFTPGADGGSDISWEADAVLGGPIGGVGQRMLGGVAKRIAKKFFADIDAAIRDGVPEAAMSRDAGSPAEEGTVHAAGNGAEAAGRGSASGLGAPEAVGAQAGPGTSANCCAPGACRPVGDSFLAGAAVGAGAALLGVCLGIVAGRR